MSEGRVGKSPAIFAILTWMAINVIFFALEVTILDDAADLNNPISLIFWVLSIVGLVSMTKVGVAFVTFAVTYAFSFNAFNVIYFSGGASFE